MGKLYNNINDKRRSFIEKQQMFFVATAANEGRVNLSPKGMDTFRVVGENRVMWLSVTGSGNETAAHLLQHNRITIMFCAFEGAPRILRIYGKARAIYPGDEEWDELIGTFPKMVGARQIFDVTVDSVQRSCGMGVPNYDFVGERNQLTEWTKHQGEQGITDYQLKKNMESIDGFPTGLLD